MGNKSDCMYNLAYIDSDNIPELLVYDSFNGDEYVCLYNNGNIKVINLTWVNNLLYLPRTGIVYQYYREFDLVNSGRNWLFIDVYSIT